MQNRSLLLIALALTAGAAEAQQPASGQWKQHEMNRPRPPRVEPAPQQLPVPAPADAKVLFGGNDLSRWEKPNGGGAAEWTVENGYFQVKPGTGAIHSKEHFGDIQLHVEWASPNPPRGTGQDRGNSGVMLMGGRYEVQVLDSYNADTYADGQAAAIYGQYPPLFNATRAPGEWQAYDIFFRRPRFTENGQLLDPARITVVHNGILVQNNEELQGMTTWLKTLPYAKHPDKGPIQLQDHGHPVRFRNIWVRELPERPAPPADYRAADRPVAVPTAQLDRLAGVYYRGQGTSGPIRVTRENNYLLADFGHRPPLKMVPVSPTEFALTENAGRIIFQLDAQGRPTGLVFRMGGADYPARRGN